MAKKGKSKSIVELVQEQSSSVEKASILGVKLPDLAKSHTEALAEQMLREFEGGVNNGKTNYS